MTPILLDPARRPPGGLFQTDEQRWNAVVSRDPRSDGAFVYAVASTGIFCRPICPARRPLRRNTRFFSDPGTAEVNGFRPCKRCRPADQAIASPDVRTQPAAIVFTDIKGFSTMARPMSPGATLELLAEFHLRLQAIVREHSGCVHKELGDGFMAVFGRDAAGADDGARALACGLAMLQAVALWNEQRDEVGLPPINLSVGLNYGVVAIGRAGEEQAVIGHTVNAASRLEQATRRLGAGLVASDDAVRAALPTDAAVPAALHRAGKIRLSGCGPMSIWTTSIPPVARTCRASA